MSESISIFDIIKIGVGPSSSHTMGPWKAAQDFAGFLRSSGNLASVRQVACELYGSLAKTGKGHGTDFAVVMGLQGIELETADIDEIQQVYRQVTQQKQLTLAGEHTLAFDPRQDIAFRTQVLHDFHPNAMKLLVTLEDGSVLEDTYFSVGGGFIVREGRERENAIMPRAGELPFPIESGAQLLAYCKRENLSVDAIVYRNELTWLSAREIDDKLSGIFETMIDAIYHGCHNGGILPGGLNVQRRARGLHDRLIDGATYENRAQWLECLRNSPVEIQSSNAWLTCFALAVNEVNASYGRIVTAPTNGACGVIPAVLFHYYLFTPGAGSDQIKQFLLVAGEVGSIFKKNATISAAAGGCQAEIGVSSAMAAAGLTSVRGGTPEQALMAAEIAMEHHLGMTCDPVGGLVQVPCIERNTMGAVKALTAAQLALYSDPALAKISLDDVVQTMKETAEDMHHKYRETSEGGLALRISVNHPEC